MPSTPRLVRPLLAALLTALLLASSLLVSAIDPFIAAAHAGTSGAPVAPPPADRGSPVSMDLVSLTPTSLAPGGTLTATLEVTNTSSAPLPEVQLELRTRTPRVTDRAMLTDWQSETAPGERGAALAHSESRETLAPGASATLTVRVAAEDLGYSEEPYFWGTRRIALTVAAEGEAIATLRTFVVWRPADATASLTQSVLLPVAAEDPAGMITDPEAFATSATSGRLAATRTLAARPEVDWWLDPALLDPPAVQEPGTGAAPDDDTDAPEGTTPGTQTPSEEETTTDSEAAPVLPTFAPEPRSVELAEALTDAAAAPGAEERTVLSLPYARADRLALDAAETGSLDTAVTTAGEHAFEQSGITPRAEVLGIDPAAATPALLAQVAATGATAALLPASSLGPSASSEVTPSSVAALETDQGSALTLLAPDPTLSGEFSALTAGTDVEQTQQRLLAETATIASEYATAPRHVLIAPSADAVLDPAAAGAVLDAFAEAPWIRAGRTAELLDAAEEGAWTTQPRAEGEGLYALGDLTAEDVHASGPDAQGRWSPRPRAEEVPLLDPATLGALQRSWQELDALAAAMEDDIPLQAAQREVLSATSVQWRGDGEVPAARAEDASATAAALRERIEVVPASGYNVISDEVSVPITISNGLDTPIRVRVEVSSDKPLVQVGEPKIVVVPARGRVDASVGVEAIANGTVTLTAVATTEDGRRLTGPVSVPLTVNPSWENWTTLVLVIAMGLLVVVGVLRARRTGAATRAPAVLGPEDPEVLARTGVSTPAVDPEGAHGPRRTDGDGRTDGPQPPSAAPDPTEPTSPPEPTNPTDPRRAKEERA